MISSKGERVKLDWLNTKLHIIKYFKRKARRDQKNLSQEFELDQTKVQEESKQREYSVEPKIILQGVYENFRIMSEAPGKKDRKNDMKIPQSDESSLIEKQDDEDQE